MCAPCNVGWMSKHVRCRVSGCFAVYAAEAELLKTIPGFGEVVTAGWLGAIGPAPHQHFGTAERLASWVTLCPGNYISARKSRSGRTGDGGNYIKPLLVQAAWAAIRAPGRLQARFHKLIRRFGGPKNKGARKKAIIAIAHSLLKIACAILRTGKPYHLVIDQAARLPARCAVAATRLADSKPSRSSNPLTNVVRKPRPHRHPSDTAN